MKFLWQLEKEIIHIAHKISFFLGGGGGGGHFENPKWWLKGYLCKCKHWVGGLILYAKNFLFVLHLNIMDYV